MPFKNDIKLLKEENCPDWVIKHSKLVCKKALEISENFPESDKKLIQHGALLHDIGRSQSNNIDHAYLGTLILQKHNYSQEIISIVERHIGTGITLEESKNIKIIPTKDYTPKTIEEQIVSHADNLTNGYKEVNVEFTANKWRIKLGENHPSIKKLYLNHEKLVITKGLKKWKLSAQMTSHYTDQKL